MPKSRRRKDAKHYRPKQNFRAVYEVPDPLALFRTIGKGTLDHDEEEAACLLLLNTFGVAEPQTVEYFTMLGVDWPPTCTDDIRAIARLLVERDREESASGATH